MTINQAVILKGERIVCEAAMGGVTLDRIFSLDKLPLGSEKDLTTATTLLGLCLVHGLIKSRWKKAVSNLKA